MLKTVKRIEEVCMDSGYTCVAPSSVVGSKEGWLASVQLLENADVVVICPDGPDASIVWWAGVAFARSKPVLVYGESVAIDVINPVGYTIASHILNPEQLKQFLVEYGEADTEK